MLVVLALGAAVFYGAGDFLGGFAARRAPALAVAVVSQSVGLALLLAVLPFIPGHASYQHALWGVLAGLFGGAGIALFYHALSTGKMGVLSPVTAVLAAALPVVAGVVLGERLSVGQFAGIALSLVAIVLISLSSDDGVREFSTAGLKEALLAGLAFGGFYVFLARSSQAPGLDALAIARVTSIAALLAVALAARVRFSEIRHASARVVAAGVADMAANVFYVFATYSGLMSLAAVLTSLYPASTVALARVVLNERLSVLQWLGVAFALAGVVLIAWRS